MAILVAVWGCVSIRNSFAQTAGEMRGEHNDRGNHTKSEGAFHRRFQDAEKWAKEFDDPERDTWQKPQEILDALHLEQTSTLADVGAGTGYFSVRIAKRIPQATIFAADVEPDMVRYLGERAQHDRMPSTCPSQSRSFYWWIRITTLGIGSNILPGSSHRCVTPDALPSLISKRTRQVDRPRNIVCCRRRSRKNSTRLVTPL